MKELTKKVTENTVKRLAVKLGLRLEIYTYGDRHRLQQLDESGRVEHTLSDTLRAGEFLAWVQGMEHMGYLLESVNSSKTQKCIL